ncbi:MAG: hypothetical protein GX495_02795 [Chloroflexi bacterium]|jgi:pyruvate kinase|nr:hypothetical protein [Chloroflexota bacterium]
MNYQIVATLGPGSSRPSVWNDMIQAGVTAFRLNTSHLSTKQLQQWLQDLQDFFLQEKVQIPVVLDLQGSKWRLGQFPPFELIRGQQVQILPAASFDRPGKLPVPHPDFFSAARISAADLYLDDARIHLQVRSIQPDCILADIVEGGVIRPRKGITFYASDYRIETLRASDQAVLELARPYGFVRYAISYVKDGAEMGRYRSFIGASAYLTAKIERGPSVEEALAIAASADELWLCRGDLGAELGLRSMAEAVSRFTGLLPEIQVPVLLAGQVFEHMVENPSPTRAEICGLYDALAAGYQGVVLSDETAAGRYPVESCRTAAIFKYGT